jgi:RND family efflux transporter MFP subunit
MRRNSICSYLVGLTLLGGLFLATAGAADPVPKIDGQTKPSDSRVLSFVRPGRVVAILVKEGEEVKKDQVIAIQDSTEEEAELKIDRENATDTTEIEVENQVHDLDAKTLERTRQAKPSRVELDEAEQRVIVDAARIKLAEMKKKQYGLTQDKTQAAIDKLTLKSPIDGIVLETYVKVGESSDVNNMKVLRIIQRNPLWVESHVPYAQARRLHIGDAATITFKDNSFSDQKVRNDAKIIYIAAMGEVGADSILVRMELSNPRNLPPGESVNVAFPSAVAAN